MAIKGLWLKGAGAKHFVTPMLHVLAPPIDNHSLFVHCHSSYFTLAVRATVFLSSVSKFVDVVKAQQVISLVGNYL